MCHIGHAFNTYFGQYHFIILFISVILYILKIILKGLNKLLGTYYMVYTVFHGSDNT